MKPHESPRIRKKSIRGDSGDSWPVWNRGIRKRISATLIDGDTRHDHTLYQPAHTVEQPSARQGNAIQMF